MELDEIESDQFGEKENEVIQAVEETCFMEDPQNQRYDLIYDTHVSMLWQWYVYLCWLRIFRTTQDAEKGMLDVETVETNEESSEPGCFESALEKCLPPRFRKHLPMIVLVLLTLLGVCSDTILAIVDVGMDYKVGIDYLR